MSFRKALFVTAQSITSFEFILEEPVELGEGKGAVPWDILELLLSRYSTGYEMI